MAAVDEYRQLDRPRSPELTERVERSSDGPPGEQDVVDEYDEHPTDTVPGNLGAGKRARWPNPQVIAVHRDVERAHGDHPVLDGAHAFRQPTRQPHTAGGNAEEQDVGATVGTFEDFVRDAGERAAHIGCVEHLARHRGLVVLAALIPRVVLVVLALVLVGSRHRRDLLPRLTGRALKDVERGQPSRPA